MPNFTLKDILTNDALDRAFITTFASAQQRAVIDLAKSFGERLENGTRQDHEAMGVFGLRDALEGVKRRLPDTWEVVGIKDALYWRLATLLRVRLLPLQGFRMTSYRHFSAPPQAV